MDAMSAKVSAVQAVMAYPACHDEMRSIFRARRRTGRRRHDLHDAENGGVRCEVKKRSRTADGRRIRLTALHARGEAPIGDRDRRKEDVPYIVHLPPGSAEMVTESAIAGCRR